jgi:hypothetical protein
MFERSTEIIYESGIQGNSDELSNIEDIGLPMNNCLEKKWIAHKLLK